MPVKWQTEKTAEEVKAETHATTEVPSAATEAEVNHTLSKAKPIVPKEVKKYTKVDQGKRQTSTEVRG